MKDILGTVGKLLSYLFAALVIGYTSTLTYMLAGRLVPGNLLLQLMTVALFDGGALCWFIMFVTQARGTTQWAMSLIGWVVGLVGAVIMVAGELILGQSLVAFNDLSRLGWVLITTVVVACVIHVTLIYLFHLVDPTVRNRIEMAQKISEKVERAYNDARKEIDRKQDQLTAGLTDSIYAEAEQMLAGITAISVRNKNRKEQTNREIMRDAPAILPGEYRDLPMRSPLAAASPAAGQRPQKFTPKQNPPKRPQGVRQHSFNNNGGHNSAEHAAFAAAPTIHITEPPNPTPPPSDNNQRS